MVFAYACQVCFAPKTTLHFLKRREISGLGFKITESSAINGEPHADFRSSQFLFLFLQIKKKNCLTHGLSTKSESWKRLPRKSWNMRSSCFEQHVDVITTTRPAHTLYVSELLPTARAPGSHKSNTRPELNPAASPLAIASQSLPI